eukprot:TRINITY_DN22684_c0_g1_i2.p2 TRINITY_DN22684_c0_g1~~TRINITY_DN22684_c0_g1_i2.p2  ORF type:complete len:130 (-),score=5.04 TRINITY_DN22684_c0_g1_i2:90-479(-)
MAERHPEVLPVHIRCSSNGFVGRDISEMVQCVLRHQLTIAHKVCQMLHLTTRACCPCWFSDMAVPKTVSVRHGCCHVNGSELLRRVEIVRTPPIWYFNMDARLSMKVACVDEAFLDCEVCVVTALATLR